MEGNIISLSALDEFPAETAGQDILRYIGLPTVLGQEKDTILYFIGRNLARQFEMNSLDDVRYIYKKLNWGQLELIKEKNNQLSFHLMADEIVHRIKSSIETEFRMEAGFLAEAVQKIYGKGSECTETVQKRLFRIDFKVFFTD